MNKILITGAAGFIGSNLVKYLLETGIKPQYLRLFISPWDSRDNLPNDKFEIIIGDIRDKKAVAHAMKGVDVVYHLAAKTVIPSGTYSYYKDTNIYGTKNLLDSAVKNHIKKFILFSSISVFGLPAWKGDMENYDERSPKIPSEPYGETKLECEKLVESYSKRYKLPYIIIRPTTVYGPNDKAGIYQLMKVINKGMFVYIGDAKNKMDYVYVKDLVKAARIAEKSNIINEDFIIGAGTPSTQEEIVTLIAKSFGKKIFPIHISKKLALTLSYLSEYISKFIGIKALFFPDRVKVLTSNCYFDSNKAKRLLGYTPSVQEECIDTTTRSFLLKERW
jgi:nucleoside-diphosphate-sugar epimerase